MKMMFQHPDHPWMLADLDRVYYCCLYGNNEDEAIIRHIDRDMLYDLRRDSGICSTLEYVWVYSLERAGNCGCFNQNRKNKAVGETKGQFSVI